DGPTDEAAKTLSPELAKKMNDLLKAPNEVRVDVHAGPKGERFFTLDRNDAAHDISIRVDGEGRHLTVKEAPTGKVLFDGPADREEDYKSLPAGVLEKVRGAMEKVK
ncbi:MAG TPA: hypothetical protein VFR10_06905, partial [bacterium]|nr:hypothetical protein [bacterium]